MKCHMCNREVELFHGKFCVSCYPEWWERNKRFLYGFGCIFSGCSVKRQNTMGMCFSHNLTYWQKGGINPNPKGLWFNPDGSRKMCSFTDCPFVVSSKGMCKHHASNAHYEKSRGKLVSRKNRKRVRYDGSLVLCPFEGCVIPIFGKNLCAGHYYQQLRGEPLTPLRNRETCVIPNCADSVSSKLNRSKICSRHRGFMTRFSLTDEEVFRLHETENYICSNGGCGSRESLHLDHDHVCCPKTPGGSRSCGKCWRGWLCRSCNLSLGFLQENPRIIQGLLDYLDGEGRSMSQE